ncbi:DegT/DnrJ/EryC1/StrS family aminotransferase [Xanthovirga aplysinae]|uniref:DegT/DnrJ/EryC1/StrS family aminotransferase n=1 Tax=Xanthovirga aplysinae TaxID=2529853 RepID=UPI0012BCB28C|nr:DegT/DnrJ/EryC1/StrS family aminotransferase [Xanthovirga aplysinae]MTI31134.1 DegT/DnrJ/EryC1/StrS family aminotransferase [Xanthovirga aplysinae]
MNVPFVDLNAQYQSIKSEVDQAIFDCLEKSHFVGGQLVLDFENAFAKYIGTKHCVGCANGTDALEIALNALGIGSGDEVIVPACSWISTAEVVTSSGAEVVFADILPNKYTIDPEDIRRKVSGKTKAIIPVHFFGRPAEMKEILDIARDFNLKVIEDCAQAHGASYLGQKVGTFGDIATFSFYPGKNLGAYGDAGAIVTNSDELVEVVRMIGNHGQKGKHNHLRIGRNSRLDTVQAAVLGVKLKQLDNWTKKRIQNARFYNQLLSTDLVKTPLIEEDVRSVFHLYVVRVSDREKVRNYLREKGIQTAIHYPEPLPFVKAYQYLGLSAKEFPVSNEYKSQILSLPMYPELTKEQIGYVCESLLEKMR